MHANQLMYAIITIFFIVIFTGMGKHMYCNFLAYSANCPVTNFAKCGYCSSFEYTFLYLMNSPSVQSSHDRLLVREMQLKFFTLA